MQEDQTFKFEVSSKAEVDSQCSCPECDSASCFVKRRTHVHCSCASRAPSGLHTHSSQNSKLVTEAKHSISKPIIIPQAQLVTEIKKKRAKSSVSVITRETVSEFVKETINNDITDSTTTIYKISNNSISQEQGNSRNISSFIKDSSEESKTKDKGSNVYCYRKKAYREGSENVYMPKRPNRNEPKDTACQKMSAAVEHSMLYHELQAPIPKTKNTSAIVNLSAADIYKKIKQAYEACSCDVCECIAGKSLQNEFCGCKPCECPDCANLNECTLNYIGTEVIQKTGEQCSCLLCDKKSCKVLDDSRKIIQDYLEPNENLEGRKCGKDCDCKRCECNKCKARSIHRTLIVAPVAGELQQHNACRCAPCECFECRHRYGVTTNGQHEISTGVNRHPNCRCEVCDDEACIPDYNQSCRCVRQSKVMSKPVERDSHDYDIRSTHVTYNNKGICKGNFETLAMFAALPSSYTKRIDQIKQCNCNHCECLSCDYMDRTNSQNVFQSPLKTHQLDRGVHGKIKYCKQEVLEQFKLENKRVFDLCGCIDYDNFDNSGVDDKKGTKRLGKKCSYNYMFDVECENTDTDYFKNRGEDASVDIFRLEKRGRLTRRRDHDSLIQSCIDTLEANKKIFQQYELSNHASKSWTSIDNFGESNHPTCRKVCYGSHRIFCPNFETDSVAHEHISECANDMDIRRNNKQRLNSSHSLFFSKSFVKESESVPVTNQPKSRESSCNSSGYDYPEYLAHFPKLTIKTCFDDVMQCDLSNNVMLKMGSNNTVVTRSSHFSVRDRKPCQSQTIIARSSKNTKVNCKASQAFDYDIQKYISQIRKLTNETRKSYMLSTCKVNLEKEFDKFKTDSASSITTNTSAKVAFNEEYIRVQKTLRDAREYSQHLVSLFEKYEKANKEFESVSERIKKSNHSIDLSINKNVNQTNKSKDTFLFQEVPTKDSECTFTSALDEIDSINKQDKYIDNRDSIHSLEKLVNTLKNENFADNNGGNNGNAFIKTNHTITKNTRDREKDSLDDCKQKRSIVKKLNKRHIQVTKRTQDFVTPQRSISQLSKLDDKQGVFIVKNYSDIVVLSDSQSLCSHRHFQESSDTKVIDTDKNTEGDCHDIPSNISQANIFEKLGQDEIVKIIEERKNIKVKRYIHPKSPTTFSKDLLTKCSTELLSKSKSIVETKTESSDLLDFPIKDLEKNSVDVEYKEIVSKPPPHESDRKAATEVICHQPIYEHAANVNKSKELKSKSFVKTETESSQILLENVDTDKNADDVKHEEITSLTPPHISDRNAATEVISNSVDEHYVNKNKALKVQSEVKRILDLPFLQIVKNPKKSYHDKNCEAMKVTTLMAQRISDHSVAVRWKAPSLYTQVEGYEVLIDGRFVQKITNPSRQMAVISCLPHIDKVLLTVRTIVSVPVADHYPAATLVYHTRKKSEMLMQSCN